MHPSESGGCRNAFSGLILDVRALLLGEQRIMGARINGQDRISPSYFSSTASLVPHPIFLFPLQTEASPPHLRSGSRVEFYKLVILWGKNLISIRLLIILQENNTCSSNNHHHHHSSGFIVRACARLLRALCVLLASVL